MAKFNLIESGFIGQLKAEQVKMLAKPKVAAELDATSWEIDLSADYPEPIYLFKQGGRGTITKGDIQAIKAKSKNGKTLLLSIFAAVGLGARFGDLVRCTEDVRICIFDTEQNPRNVAKVAKRIHAMLRWDMTKNSPDLRVFALRQMDMGKRLDFIKNKVQEIRPTIAFVDGIADLINNFNDVVESAAVIDELMKLSAENDCAIINILHTNKGKEDSGMKGHLGTLLLQKASDVFEIKKNGINFEVTHSDSRNQAIDDFSFTLDNDAVPQPIASAKTVQADAKAQAIMDGLRKALADGALGHNDLKRRYALMVGNSPTSSTNTRHIKDALNGGFLIITPDGKYDLRDRCHLVPNYNNSTD